MNPLYFCNRTWGPDYTSTWLDVALASQLAPDNLPYAAAHAPCCKYIVFTNYEDKAMIEAHPNWKKVEELMDTILIFIPEDVRKGKWFSEMQEIVFHSHYSIMAWCDVEGMMIAAREGASLFPLAPDNIHSNGSFRTAVQHLAAGRHAVMAGACLRVKAEVFKPTSFEARDLVRLAMQNLHPCAGHFFWQSQTPITSPYKLCWPVGEQGVVSHALILVPLAVTPRRPLRLPFLYSDDDWPVLNCDPEDMALVLDSDEAFIAEATREDFKFGSPSPQVYDECWLGDVFRQNFIPHQWDFLRHATRIHSGTILEQDWDSVEQRARFIIENILQRVRSFDAGNWVCDQDYGIHRPDPWWPLHLIPDGIGALK